MTFMTFKDADAMAVAMGDAPSVWVHDPPPGGYVCGTCGMPVEDVPCAEHQPYASGGSDAC